MKVHGKALEYRLYIDGVKIPINSFSVTSTSNEGARLTVNLLPIPAALNFMRGQLVHLFKIEGTNAPVLRFFGILKNVAYTKSVAMRSVNIEAGSPDCRWEVLKMSEFCGRNIGCLGEMKAVVDSTTADPEKLKANVELFNSRRAVVGMSNPAVMSSFMGNALNVTTEGMNGDYMSTQNGGKPPDQADPSPTDVSLAAVSSVNNMITKAIARKGGDVLRGMWDVILNAYNNSNEYNRLEFSRTHLSESVEFLNFGLTNGDDNIFRMDAQLTGPNITAEQTTSARQQMATAFYKFIENILNDVSGGGTPIKSILVTLLNYTLCRMSIDPTKMTKSIILHPIMMGLMPPRCNVIFPNQYSSLVFNPNKWMEPTRSAITFPPAGMSPAEYLSSPGAQWAGAVTIFSDTTDPTMQALKTGTTQAGSLDNSSAVMIQSYKDLSKLMTEEETWKGVLCDVRPIGFAAFASLTSTDTAFIV